MRKIPIFFVILVLLSGFAVAQTVQKLNFALEVEPVKDKILSTDSAEFLLTIKNTQSMQDTFRILPLEDVKWTHQIVPITDKIKTISGKGSAQIRVLVKPSGVADGVYNLKLTVESENTNQRLDAIMKVYVGPHPSMYSPNLSVSYDFPDKIDPKGSYSVEVKMKNNNIIDLGSIHLSVSSSLVNSDQYISVGPDEEKVVSIAVSLPDDQQPTSDTLHIKVTKDDTVFFDESKPFEVVEYLPPFVKNVTETSSFLKRTKIIRLTNEGNALKQTPVRIETSRRESFFTRTDPKARLVTIDGVSYLSWDVSLKPGESTELSIVRSYRKFVFLLLVLVVAYFLYLWFRSPIRVSKKTKDVHYDDGAIHEAKVILHLKNIKNHPVKQVKVIERIPSLFGIKKGSFKHALEPTKAYQHRKEGSVLEYEIGDLEAKEERIISYAVRAKMQVVGSVEIKPTIVKFQGKNGQVQKSFSNQITLPGTE